ncbi:MAG: hypothetical protein OSJ73_08200 [Lachnospiraceae bacterium]|nr:hypothetical protein [Lachnospiraceae bacterium]HBV83923.1 phage tail sheath protein [Lachnospiraceae bacterium]
MGTPKIVIEFLKKSATLIKRSGRGMAVLILQDETQSQVLNPYMGIDEVNQDDWTERNYDYIKMTFKAEPNQVLCVRAVVKDGVIDVKATLELVRYINFDYMASPYFNKSDGDIIKAFIKKVRSEGKKAKAVLADYEADCEAVINFATPAVTVVWDLEAVTYTAQEYSCRIAGILAAVPLTQSSTYYELKEIVDAVCFDDADAQIDKGKLIIIFDGSRYKIARGVTSLQTISQDHPMDFQKIKVIEGADIIRYDIRSTFEDAFVGKMNNTYDNKQLLIGAINQYLKDLEDTVVDKENDHYVDLDMEAVLKYLRMEGIDTDDLTEQQIRETNTGAAVYLAGKIKLLDAVEDLYLKISL